MSTTSERLEYHQVTFASRVEAAAFVAALSRYLSSPFHAATLEPAKSDTVLVRATGGSVELYLSDGALRTARAAFPPVPIRGTLVRDAVPADCAPVIGRETPPPWGLDEAQDRLAEVLSGG